MADDKARADVLLVERKLAVSREMAQRIILAGQARVGADRIQKPSQMISKSAVLSVDQAFPYASRGALKLIKALDTFGADVSGAVCLDIGASTGGFTDALLSRGAAFVYAVDVGYGQIADKLRSDPRVRVMERTNARNLTPAMLTERDAPPSVSVMDVSFISIKLLVQAIFGVLSESGRLISLIKPQFEAGRGKVGKGGVVRSADDHIRILSDVAAALAGLGMRVENVTYSPIKGQTGNIEFLFDIRGRSTGSENNMTNKLDYGKIDMDALCVADEIRRVVFDAHRALD